MGKNVPTISDNDKRAKALIWAQGRLKDFVLKRMHGDISIKLKDGKILYIEPTPREIPPE